MSQKAKKAVRMILSVLLSVILSVQVTVSVFAAEGEREVEPRLTTAYYLPVENIKQINDFWCWAACGASIVNWMTGDDELQSEFCFHCTGNTVDTTMPLSILMNKLYIYYDITSIFTEIDSGYSDIQEAPPLLSLYQIKQNIDSGKPIFANLYHWDSEQGHCVVINGYTYNDVLGTATIKYMGPSVGRYVDMPYDEFCSNSTWVWLEALYSLEYIG